MKYVIVGAGAVGLSIADEVARRGNEVTIVSRGAPQAGLPTGTVFMRQEVTGAGDLAPACEGAAFLVLAAGEGPDRTSEATGRLAESIIGAARACGASLVAIDSMGAYGDNLGIPMSEATPERPTCPDETRRGAIARQILEAHKSGIKALVARCCTLYGPRVTGSPLGESVFAPVATGKPARMIGRLDMPHAFTYVKDLARAVATLCENDEAWGKFWHVPCPQPITQQQVLDILRDLTSRPVSAELVGSRLLGLKSAFNPALKQYADLMYRFEKPYVVNHSRFSTSFGERTTFHPQALFETLEWYRQRAGITRRYGL
jgi:nucleoside-diphosphate-sugar epimerase